MSYLFLNSASVTVELQYYTKALLPIERYQGGWFGVYSYLYMLTVRTATARVGGL